MQRKYCLFFLLVVLPLSANPWGKDADLCCIKRSPEIAIEGGPLVRFSEVIIGFHKKVISPADGPRSHFLPNSSQYTLDAIHKYGFFWGYLLGCDRLLRENRDPWIYPQITNDQGMITKWDPVR